jgi:hypothetical protein
MANFFGNRMGIKAIGQRTSVPDNDLARLMYYLSCVDTVIQYHEIDRLTDYQNYDSLDVEDITVLLELVILFNPKFLVDKGIFILDESLLPNDLDNQFYQITDERIGIHINNEIMVSGRTVKVLKVMACDEEWIFRNYINPLKRAFNKEAEYERRRPLPPPQPVNIRPPVIIVQPPPKQSYMPPPPAPKRGKEDISCCCCF